MYKFLSIFIFSVLCCAAARAQMERHTPPLDATKYVEVSDDNHDFGKIPYGIPVEYHVSLKNISDDTLALTNIVVSCGCTTPHYKPGVYAPGSTIDLTVAYNGRSDGPFKKQLSVLLQDDKAGQIVKILRFQGTGVVKNKTDN